MALIKCHECGKEVSDSAVQCPHCGCKTSHGQNLGNAKVLLWKLLIAVVALGLGAFLVSNAWTQLAGHTSFYWEHNNNEKLALILKMAVGGGIILGGIIVMALVNDERKSLVDNGKSSAPTKESTPAFIPEDKRKHGRCCKCGAEGSIADCRLPDNQYGSYSLCSKCITRYRGQIR